MKKLTPIFVLCAAGCFAQSTGSTAAPPAHKKAAKATKTTAARVAQPLTIPTGASPNADGSYSYTDKAGKKWIYNRTPFGVSKIQDMGADNTAGFTTTPKDQLIHATDNGDTVKFERQTPFGATRWERKKSELTDEERSIYQSQTAKPASSETKPE